jgi:hypothetical protein
MKDYTQHLILLVQIQLLDSIINLANYARDIIEDSLKDLEQNKKASKIKLEK